jgi:hypothetical protein
VLKKRSNDVVIMFWKAFGVCMEGALLFTPHRTAPRPACLPAAPPRSVCQAHSRPCIAVHRSILPLPGGKDSPNQAILQFEQLQSNNDVSLAATAACLFAHKRCRLVDQEAVDMLSFSIDSKQS